MHYKTENPRLNLIRQEIQKELGLPDSKKKFRALLEIHQLVECYDVLQLAYSMREDKNLTAAIILLFNTKLATINLSSVDHTRYKRALDEYLEETNTQKFFEEFSVIIGKIEFLIDCNLPAKTLTDYYQNTMSSDNDDELQTKTDGYSSRNCLLF